MNNTEISHKEFTLVSNEAESYLRLKDSIRTKDSQRADIEGDTLIEHGKGIGVDEILRKDEKRILKLKTEV